MRSGIPALGLTAAALAGLIALEMSPVPTGAGGPPAAPAALSATAAPPGLADARLIRGWVATILDRPLFEPSRRAPSVASAAGSGTAFPRLAGIVVTPRSREAIFAVPGQSRPVVLRAGSRLDGMLITAIGADGITVQDGHGTRTIRPSFAPAREPAPAPAAGFNTTIDLPSTASGAGKSPFASIRGLTGRPLGLVAHPNPPLPPSFGVTNTPSLPAPAPTGGSP